MTEHDWLNGDDWQEMLAYIHGQTSLRKVILYDCAALRQIWHLLYDSASRQAVEVAEEAVDGKVTAEELKVVAWGAECPTFGMEFSSDGTIDPECFKWTDHAEHLRSFIRQVGNMEARRQLLNAAGIAEMCVRSCESNLRIAEMISIQPAMIDRYFKQHGWPGAWLVREIYGNPFRPVEIRPEWLSWDGGTVPAIAEGIYEERAFGRLPILADALEDAGCDDVAILEHCRQPGRHARGCWVIDSLLGLK